MIDLICEFCFFTQQPYSVHIFIILQSIMPLLTTFLAFWSVPLCFLPWTFNNILLCLGRFLIFCVYARTMERATCSFCFMYSFLTLTYLITLQINLGKHFLATFTSASCLFFVIQGHMKMHPRTSRVKRFEKLHFHRIQRIHFTNPFLFIQEGMR